MTIRFAPFFLVLMLAPALGAMPHLDRGAALVMVGVLAAGLVGFYQWSGVWVRRRYGAVVASARENERPLMMAQAGLILAGLALRRFVDYSDWSIAVTVLIAMLGVVVNSDYDTRRRIAWAAGIVVLFSAGPFLARFDNGLGLFSLAGAVWLGLSFFDLSLLSRG